MKPFRMKAALPSLALTAAALTAPVVTADLPTPEDAAWSLRFDAERLFDSPLGVTLLDAARDQEPRIDEWLVQAEETVGLDLREDIGHAVVYGGWDFARGITVAADLTAGPGKLEGWMLALPGYQSEDLDDETLLHSFIVEEAAVATPADADGVGALDRPAGRRVYIALPSEPDGSTRLVAAFDRGDASGMAAAARAGDLPDVDLADDRIAALRVSDLPRNQVPANAPGSAIVDSIAGGELTLGSGERIALDLSLDATSAARARQLGQLLTGMQGMLGFVAVEQPELAEIARTLQQTSIVTDENNRSVSAALSVSQADFERLLGHLVQNAN